MIRPMRKQAANGVENDDVADDALAAQPAMARSGGEFGDPEDDVVGVEAVGVEGESDPGEPQRHVQRRERPQTMPGEVVQERGGRVPARPAHRRGRRTVRACSPRPVLPVRSAGGLIRGSGGLILATRTRRRQCPSGVRIADDGCAALTLLVIAGAAAQLPTGVFRAGALTPTRVVRPVAASGWRNELSPRSQASSSDSAKACSTRPAHRAPNRMSPLSLGSCAARPPARSWAATRS